MWRRADVRSYETRVRERSRRARERVQLHAKRRGEETTDKRERGREEERKKGKKEQTGQRESFQTRTFCRFMVTYPPFSQTLFRSEIATEQSLTAPKPLRCIRPKAYAAPVLPLCRALVYLPRKKVKEKKERTREVTKTTEGKRKEEKRRQRNKRG